MQELHADPSAIVGAAPRAKTSLASLIDREARRHRTRRILWGLALLGVPAVAAGIWFATRPRPVPMAERFTMATAEVGDIAREVQASGHLEAESTVNVGAEVSARILSVLVDYNDQVHAGQVLARFDAASLDAQVAEIGASLEGSRATLAQAESDRDQAAENLARTERLFASRVMTEADRDTSRFALRSAEAHVRAAHAQIAAQQAALVVARTNQGHTEIVSPIDGVVITRNVDPGQTVISALQSPVLFTLAEDLRRMRVIAAVDEADVGEVRAGQNASFTVNAFPDRTFIGVVTELRNDAVVVQDVVTYGTVIEVDNDDLALRPGMTASARIRTGDASAVLRVPNAALHFVPPGETAVAGSAVWTLDGSTLHRLPVRAAMSDSAWTEIQTGLGAGTPVITDLTHTGRLAYDIAH